MGAVIFIAGVILMVVIHEGGHFVAAKAFNMKATQAFFGFGPRIWSMTRGETEYGIKALPLGGYVRIIGMNPLEEVAPEDEGRTYRENPFWKKSVVVLAGIASHFVIAFILIYAVLVGYGLPNSTTSIGRVCAAVVAPSEPVSAQPFAGSRCEIVAVDGVPVEDWTGSTGAPGRVTEVTVEREGVRETFRTTDMLLPTPALLSDVRSGDRIVEFDGVAIEEWVDFQDAAVARPGRTVTVVAERGGALISFESTLAARTAADGTVSGFFGVVPETVVEDYGVFSGIPRSGSRLWETIELSIGGLGSLVTNFGDLVGAVISGTDVPDEARPISFVGLAGVAAKGPIVLSLELLAVVNVFVGILNVFPMYPLDGGHFSVALYEKIRGRAADVRKLMPIAVALFIFLFILFLMGFYFDFVDPIKLVIRSVP